MRAIALPRPPPPTDHFERAMVMLEADADLRNAARAADADPATGTSYGQEDQPADYDLASW